MPTSYSTRQLKLDQLAGLFVAGQLGALAVFLLRRMRRSIVGWLLTGFWIAFIGCGTIGLAVAVFHDRVGALLMEDSSPTEAWQSLRNAPWLGGIGGIGGAWQWWRDRSRHA